MRLFNVFNRNQKKPDDLFGELNYSTFKDKSKNFYEGSVLFNSKRVGIMIDADETGPTNAQKKFYISLNDNYNSFKNTVIIPFLKEELLAFDLIADFDKEFSIDGISLPRITREPIQWTLTIFSNKIKHYISINFIDLIPQPCVIIDG